MKIFVSLWHCLSFGVLFNVYYLSTGSYQAETYVDRLIKLEAALEKQRNATRFYTPSAPIIGLNATFTSPYNVQSDQVIHDQSQIFDDDVVIEGELEEDYIDEYQDMSGSELVDRMEELDDSTEEP